MECCAPEQGTHVSEGYILVLALCAEGSVLEQCFEMCLGEIHVYFSIVAQREAYLERCLFVCFGIVVLTAGSTKVEGNVLVWTLSCLWFCARGRCRPGTRDTSRALTSALHSLIVGDWQIAVREGAADVVRVIRHAHVSAPLGKCGLEDRCSHLQRQ